MTDQPVSDAAPLASVVAPLITSRPYVINLVGGVAVGKSVLAPAFAELLRQRPDHPNVEVIGTDGFLLPEATLGERGLAHRKGFPESFDTARLQRFLDELHRGLPTLEVPIYSHVRYDVLPGPGRTIQRPDVAILEGVHPPDSGDLTIYLDAPLESMHAWFLERAWRVVAERRNTPGEPPLPLTDEQIAELIDSGWYDINLVNLTENISHWKARADIVVTKGPHHEIAKIDVQRKAGRSGG